MTGDPSDGSTATTSRSAPIARCPSSRRASRLTARYACTRFNLAGHYLIGANADLIDVSQGNKLVSTGPPVDGRDCVGRIVSNGRIFYTAQASGLQFSQVGAPGTGP